MEVKSTMAGTVLQISVSIGDQVEVNQEVALLESMKMEIPIDSLALGVVKEVKVSVGDFVNEGDTLIILD